MSSTARWLAASTFQPGDRVRTGGKLSALLRGQVGTIQEITPKGWVWVVLDNVPSAGPGGAWAFAPRELEKI